MDVTKRTEKKNNAAELKKGREKARRLKGKGRLTDEEPEAEAGNRTVLQGIWDTMSYEVFYIWMENRECV